jgi:uracil phosphoribosyltransferase
MVLEQLSLARDKRSSQVAFRKAINRLGRSLAYEFLRTLKTKTYKLETPLAKTTGERIKGTDKIVIVLILRAAIPFVEGMYKMLPMAQTGIISAWRGEAPQWKVEIRYSKLPTITRNDIVIIADPMLATGHTTKEVVKRIIRAGRPKRLVVFSVIATMKGITYVHRAFPQTEFYTCAVDPELDTAGYIVPGLGDAGDRSFGPPT